MRITLDEVTPRDRQEHEWQVEILDKQLDHQRQMQELTNELAEIETRITAWFRVPILLVKLPVFLIMAIAYCIMAIRGDEADDKFWEYLK